MQELAGRNDNPQMDRIATNIRKAPLWLKQHHGHAWSDADAGIRLVMFGQLKIWAEKHFHIDDWYPNPDDKPSIYSEDQGWNLVKLMHRKARGDRQGDQDINYCDAEETGLSDGDQLMVCASYVSGFDLSAFFESWNPGEMAFTLPTGGKSYQGGISAKGFALFFAVFEFETTFRGA